MTGPRMVLPGQRSFEVVMIEKIEEFAKAINRHEAILQELMKDYASIAHSHNRLLESKKHLDRDFMSTIRSLDNRVAALEKRMSIPRLVT